MDSNYHTTTSVGRQETQNISRVCSRSMTRHCHMESRERWGAWTLNIPPAAGQRCHYTYLAR
jgi:hypothetical protein